MTDLVAQDCLPIKCPDAETRTWLERLMRSVRAGEHAIAFDDASKRDDEPIVYYERDGTLTCGRYIGTITFEGRRLNIVPRLGMETIGRWLEAVLGIRFTQTPGDAHTHDAFLPQLLARIWGHSVVRAARHGLPALRVDHDHHGPMVRGRLDVRKTIAEQERGRPGVTSVQRLRSLDNAIVEAIVAAYAVLRRRLGALLFQRIVPDRALDLLAPMLAVVPTTVAVPSDREIDRVRFTPITAGYRPLVRLSLSIARNRGLFSDTSLEGKASGVLLDVAELWELFVVECIRRAFPRAAVFHGTRDLRASGYLLRASNGRQLGHLFPDVLIRTEDCTVIADAKYKRLSRPPDREDLYQMRAYLSRWTDAAAGALIYPQESSVPDVIANGPWRFDDERQLLFVALPTQLDDAIAAAATAFASLLPLSPVASILAIAQ